MVHLIGIPALILVGAILDRLFFNKVKAVVTADVAKAEADIKKI
jgi:hypothetical protein